MDLPGPVFLNQKLTHVITTFHPKKPRTDVSVIPGEKEENAYFTHHSADLVFLGLTPAKIYPALPLSQDHRGEARLGRRMGKAMCSSGYFGKLPN